MFKIGNLIVSRGLDPYLITTGMAIMRVMTLEDEDGEILVEVIHHKYNHHINESYPVQSKYFKLYDKQSFLDNTKIKGES